MSYVNWLTFTRRSVSLRLSIAFLFAATIANAVLVVLGLGQIWAGTKLQYLLGPIVAAEVLNLVWWIALPTLFIIALARRRPRVRVLLSIYALLVTLMLFVVPDIWNSVATALVAMSAVACWFSKDFRRLPASPPVTDGESVAPGSGDNEPIVH